jgi:hypothetical protein
MILFLRALVTILVAVFFALFFLVAFAKAIDSQHAQVDGLIIGFMSALAWGLSVFGASGLLNFLAALFAAISLGCLTAVESVCTAQSSVAWFCYAATWIADFFKT